MISELTDLRILRILNWPAHGASTTSGREYLAKLDDFANLVVRRLTRHHRSGSKPRLKVLTFGKDRFPIENDPYKLMPEACYVVSSLVTSDGHPHVHVRRTGLHMMQYEEVLCDYRSILGNLCDGLYLGGGKNHE